MFGLSMGGWYLVPELIRIGGYFWSRGRPKIIDQATSTVEFQEL